MKLVLLETYKKHRLDIMKSEKDKQGEKQDKNPLLKKEWKRPVLKTLSLNATLSGESATSNDFMSRSGS
jgi:hypothetical protein